MKWIDLRSDTVTQPTAAMREAMAQAEVGDDVYGEDPTVNRLQDLAAEMVGMEAAILVPSGTMGNLAALLAHCDRGEEVIVGDRAHTYMFEAGGVSALGGLHTFAVPNEPDGSIPLDALRSAIRADDPHYPRTGCITIENTHNLCGGSYLSAAYTRAVSAVAEEHDIRLHIDGARVFNAAVAQDISVQELTKPADSVTFCLSKGLSAPVGSMICGCKAFIDKVHRVRKQLGGGMRQAGVLAAAGIVALETMVTRLAEDHQRARRLAEGLSGLEGLTVETVEPPTNMVYMRLEDTSRQVSERLVADLAGEGIRINPPRGGRIRLVTHYWIDDAALEKTIDALARSVSAG
ncbi:MAG: low-specificity L-threonine aldolase [Anaerolineales bacterium]|nr:low-specificity L-threonine aldolase [Anaerolineales bacterium]